MLHELELPGPAISLVGACMAQDGADGVSAVMHPTRRRSNSSMERKNTCPSGTGSGPPSYFSSRGKKSRQRVPRIRGPVFGTQVAVSLTGSQASAQPA